jgi:D-glycero-alpha-D-manno-heptose 1-phosphate guanylyltransferase
MMHLQLSTHRIPKPERAVLSSPGCPTAVILAGGMGSRLRPVINDRAKVMAPVHGVPFLAFLFEHLSRFGCQRVVVCTGIRAESISDFFGTRYRDMTIKYVRESEVRGTGGALRHAVHDGEQFPILVMNGDSFCEVNISRFVHWHREKGHAVSMVLTRVDQVERFGNVEYDKACRLITFCEKGTRQGSGWINAGWYLMERTFVESIPDTCPSSLEHDVFPRWIPLGIGGYPANTRFLDIGTPASYRMAETFFSPFQADPVRRQLST